MATAKEKVKCPECSDGGISHKTGRPCQKEGCENGPKWGQHPGSGRFVPRAEADKAREAWYAAYERRTGKNIRPPAPSSKA